MLNFNHVETDLAKELQKRKFRKKGKGVEDRRICKESPEVQQLLQRIKHAYMNKERAAQQHEKQVRKIMDIRQEAEMDEMMLQARSHEKIIQQQRLVDQRIEMNKAKEVLFYQMQEKQDQVKEAKEQYIVEKQQVEDIVQRIRDQDHNKFLQDKSKKKQCFQDMLESLQDKRDKIQREQDREDEENRLYLLHLAKKEKRQKMFAQQKEEVERAKAKIFKKLKAEQEFRDKQTTEWETLQEELYREILEKKAREQERIELEKRQQQKQTMQKAEQQARKLRQQLLDEQLRQKLMFQTQMNSEFAKDIQIEHMNAEKRKMKLLEHRREIERLWKQKLEQFQAEKQKEINQHTQLQAEESYRQQIVDQEKQRLLREHMPYIQDFMPKGMLEPIDFTKIADKAQINSYNR